MRGALEVCREHGQPPSWWAGLDRGDRALLLADRADRIETQDRAARKAEAEARRGRR
jgi:hypothetical protein